MRRLLLRLFFFLLPFILAMIIELFFLPINKFTFRTWEALQKRMNWIGGPFYPDKKLAMEEEGDLGHHTPYALRRQSEWETDSCGFRKSATNKKIRIVVIGDSNVAGAGLTQKDMFSEVLEDLLGVGVYPFAPETINGFLQDIRFIQAPPEIVILAVFEHNIPGLFPKVARQFVTPSPLYQSLFKVRFLIMTNPIIQAVNVTFDRIIKAPMLYFIRAQIRRSTVEPKVNYLLSADGRMLFLEGFSANHPKPKATLDQSIQRTSSYAAALKERGVRFIFLPIPNKENIYHDLLPIRGKPVFLDQLIEALTLQGVETLNIQKGFEEARRDGESLYIADDSHWNENGSKIAARLAAEQIRSVDAAFGSKD